MTTNSKAKILMYHAVIEGQSSIPPDREVGAELYDLPVELFKGQMNYLHDQGYNVGLIEEANDVKSVVITFDDGEMNNFETALPILQHHDFKAYFFIIAARVGKKGYMGWPEILKMHQAGMVIGSHGLSHQILTDISETQLEEELGASKRTIEFNLGQRIDSLSIPRGYCNDFVIKKAYDVGYKTIFISDRPRGLTIPCWSRLAVKHNWSLKQLENALEGKVSVIDGVKAGVKQSVKSIMPESWYNQIRTFLIKQLK